MKASFSLLRPYAGNCRFSRRRTAIRFISLLSDVYVGKIEVNSNNKCYLRDDRSEGPSCFC